MREIKFRAWVSDQMFYNVQGQSQGNLGYSFSELLEDSTIVVEQFTGLYDKNDKEIYEGDIVSGLYARPYICTVEYIKAGFRPFVTSELGDPAYQARECVIVGNIHENYELSAQYRHSEMQGK